MKYRIRPAGAGDSAQLAVLVCDLGYPVTRDFIEEKLSQLAGTPGTKVLPVSTSSLLKITTDALSRRRRLN